MRAVTLFSLHRSNILYITWGGLLERHMKFVSYSFSLFTWLSKGIAIGDTGLWA